MRLVYIIEPCKTKVYCLSYDFGVVTLSSTSVKGSEIESFSDTFINGNCWSVLCWLSNLWKR